MVAVIGATIRREAKSVREEANTGGLKLPRVGSGNSKKMGKLGEEYNYRNVPRFKPIVPGGGKGGLERDGDDLFPASG